MRPHHDTAARLLRRADHNKKTNDADCQSVRQAHLDGPIAQALIAQALDSRGHLCGAGRVAERLKGERIGFLGY